MTGATILKLIYGIEAQASDDRNIALSEKAVDVLSDMANAGAYMGKTSIRVSDHLLNFDRRGFNY